MPDLGLLTAPTFLFALTQLPLAACLTRFQPSASRRGALLIPRATGWAGVRDRRSLTGTDPRAR